MQKPIQESMQEPMQKSIYEPWNSLFRHMELYHKDAQYFGDSIIFDPNSDYVESHVCQLCGKELVNDSKQEIINE